MLNSAIPNGLLTILAWIIPVLLLCLTVWFTKRRWRRQQEVDPFDPNSRRQRLKFHFKVDRRAFLAVRVQLPDEGVLPIRIGILRALAFGSPASTSEHWQALRQAEIPHSMNRFWLITNYSDRPDYGDPIVYCLKPRRGWRARPVAQQAKSRSMGRDCLVVVDVTEPKAKED